MTCVKEVDGASANKLVLLIEGTDDGVLKLLRTGKASACGTSAGGVDGGVGGVGGGVAGPLDGEAR